MVNDSAGSETVRLTVLGTTDLHGNAVNWDYLTNAEYDDAAHNDIGLAKIATLVAAVRAERGPDGVLLLDAGDTIQGNPLAYYYARVEPITDGHLHPMAAAMNAIGYDAAALGNHEFDYGLDILRRFTEQLDFPLLGANAQDWATDLPVFPPYLLKQVSVRGRQPVTVGILGLTNPGTAIWARGHVEGVVRFGGIVEQAAVWVPRMRAAGADVVVVSAHSGADLSSSYGDALPFPENAAGLMAEEVPGIDAVLVGHAHVEIAERFVVNRETSQQVLLVEPLAWGMRLAMIELELVTRDGRWAVVDRRSRLLNTNTVEGDPEITALLSRDHDTVVGYVSSVIGRSTTAMSAATARWQASAALDLVNHVQARSVADALAGTPQAGLPVLAITSPFNRSAAIPAGEVSIRDVAGLYNFDNTLLGVTMTGGQLKDYLEHSARYFRQVTGPGPFRPDEITNAPTDTAPRGTPDYDYDVVSGLAEPLGYDIDLAEPVGSRIAHLSYGGAPVEADQLFVVAVNSYRQSGSAGFPHVSTAPVVDDRRLEIRQLIIDHVTAEGRIDPAAYPATDWRLTANGQPVIVTP